MNARRLLILTLGAALAAAPAVAHDTWLMAERMAVPPGTAVVLNLTSGMAFPALDYAVKAERIASAACRTAGKRSDLLSRKAGPHSLRLTARLTESGVASCWLHLAPKALTLAPDKVLEYLAEIGAGPEAQRTWEAGGKKWREIYTKHAKTFVRVGSPAEDRSWAEPVGLGLEIVPEADPTALTRDFPVRVLSAGKPLAGFPLGLVREGDAHGVLQTTDAEGRVTFRLDRPGRWLLRGTFLRRSAQKDVDWESDFTTLTVESHRQN